jgi:hypothetical protein
MSANQDVPSPGDVVDGDDPVTPDILDAWSAEERERYKKLKEQSLQASADSRFEDLAAEQQEALSAIESAVTGEEPETATLTVGDADLTVKTRIPGAVENAVATVQDNPEDIGQARDALIDAIVALIVDDGEDGRHRYTQPRVWTAFHEEHGTEGLVTVLESLLEPAEQRLEDLEKFRGDEHRRRPR